MSACTFIASNASLPTVKPSKEYPLFIDLDHNTVWDGDADDNYFLVPFKEPAFDFSHYTDKKYCVSLEWRYTEGRAKQILAYIKKALENDESVEIWRVWLSDFYDYEESPVLKRQFLSWKDLTVEDLREMDEADFWNHPDPHYPDRPSFYCLVVER